MELENPTPYGTAYINGYRLVYNPYFFTKGKHKGKIKCYYRKGNGFRSIILKESDIKLIKSDEEISKNGTLDWQN